MKTRKRGIILTALGIILFSLLMIHSPGEAQYIGPGFPVFNPLAIMLYPPAPLFSPLYYPIIPPLPFAPLPISTAVVPTRTAAQTGTWLGTWTSTWIAYIVLYHSGPMSLNIVVDPFLGLASGTAVLQGSKYLNVPFTVTGVKVNNLITLEGVPALGLGVTLDCLLTSPTNMIGFYSVISHADLVDEGTFNLNLAAPVI